MGKKFHVGAGPSACPGRPQGAAPTASLFLLFLLFLSGCIYNINLIPTVQPMVEKQLTGTGADKILLIDLSGLITDQEQSGAFVTEPSPVAQIKEELELAARDPAVKAVVIRINSPGGTVTASDVIHHELIEFKKRTGVKVIASIMDLGTSGGYYAALAADRIIAHPTAVTGSIGVIMLNIRVDGLLEKIGVSGTAIKSGDKKDMGSPFRAMTEEERKIFQDVINQMHDRFITAVAQGRKNLTLDQIKKIADGRIYTAQQALQLGLVDQIGYLEDAVAMARKETGIAQARVVTYHRPGRYKANIYSQLPNHTNPTVNLFNVDLRSVLPVGLPQFMYLWVP